MEKSKGKLIVSVVFRSVIIVFLLIGVIMMIAEEFYIDGIADYYYSDFIYASYELAFIVLTLIEIKNLICDIMQLSSIKGVKSKNEFGDLEKLFSLKEKNLITEEEFEEKRKQIVENI